MWFPFIKLIIMVAMIITMTVMLVWCLFYDKTGLRVRNVFSPINSQSHPHFIREDIETQ